MSNKLTLCLDFGNTRKKAAIFENGEIISEPGLSTGSAEEIAFVLNCYNPQFSILSSVISHDEAIEKLLEERTVFHKVSHKTIHKFTTPVGKPETIGSDRLALAAAAIHFYPEKNNLIIALGSC
ncbi:MAG: type III pantothenate kinase, partial [Ferruginibacter sp.]